MRRLMYTLLLALVCNFSIGQTVVDVIVNSPDHTILETAVIAAELADDLSGDGPFTVFAPTDDAFAALPAGTVDALLIDPTGDLATILLYHVLGAEVLSTSLTNGQVATTLQGEDITVTIDANGVFINEAQVTIADIQTSNGVVHVIDAVILPPSFTQTVVDVIVDSPVHETLETAVIAAELADDLSGDGPFTVFAPTDDAFAALPTGVLDDLLVDPTGALANILLYHVIGAEVFSTDLSNGQVATTLLGEDVTVTIDANGVFINQAQVTIADIEAANGVVHVIDAVLLPPSVNVTDLEKVRFQLAPNPTAGFVQIELPQELLNTDVEIQVADFMGKILEKRTVNSAALTIDLSAYPNGNYTILLLNDTNYAINKVVKN